MKAISVLIEEFLGSQDVNELSRREYRSVVNYLVRWVVEKGLDFWKLKRAHVIQYKADMLRRGLSVYTIGLYMTVARKLFDFLTREGYYEENVALGVRAPKKDKVFRKNYLSMEKVDFVAGDDRPGDDHGEEGLRYRVADVEDGDEEGGGVPDEGGRRGERGEVVDQDPEEGEGVEGLPDRDHGEDPGLPA